MPMVRYGQRRLETRPIVGFKGTAAETPESLGAGLYEQQARTQQQVGAAASTAFGITAGEMQRIATREKNRADDYAVMSQQNVASARLTDWLTNEKTGALTRKGQDARTLPQDFEEFFTKLANDTGGQLHNNEQRDAYNRWLQVQHQSNQASVARYALDQNTEFEAKELAAKKVNTVSGVAQNANDWGAAGQVLADGEAAVRRAAAYNHDGKETLDADLLALRTQAHGALIHRLLDLEKPNEARKYFEGVKDQIDGNTRGDLEKELQQAVDDNAALGTANKIIASTPDKKERLKQVDAIDKDAKLHDAVQRRVLLQNQLDDQAKDDLVKDTLNKAYTFIVGQGKNADALKLPSEWQKTIAEHMPSLISFADSQARGRAVVTDLKTWGMLRDQMSQAPEAFAARTDLESFANRLAPEDLKWFLNARATLNDPSLQKAAIANASIDDQQFNVLAQGAGLQPFKTTKTAADKEGLDRLRYAVESEIQRLQAAARRPLTPKEKGDVVTSVLDQHVMMSHWNGDVSVAAATVIQSDQASTYVPFAAIPKANVDAFVTEIVRASPQMLELSHAGKESEVIAQFKDRIQRAYARLLEHRSDDEVIAVLLGLRK